MHRHRSLPRALSPWFPSLGAPIALTLALALGGACGDDMMTSAGGSASESTATTTGEATGGETAGTTTGDMTGGPGTTDDASTSPTTTTDPGTTDESAGESESTTGSTTSTTTTGDESESDATGTTTGPLEITDFDLPGPFSIDESDGSQAVGGTCQMSYRRYIPVGAEDGPLAIVVHGFTQNKSNMAGIAARIASHGVEAVAPDLCHASLIDTNHPKNGSDLVLLAEALAPGREIIYVGYSAGGLATFIAAASDSDTRALLGLDPVDADDLGAMAAPGIDGPTLALHGVSGMCNNNGDSFGLAKLVPGGWALEVIGASHCDFQGDSGFPCFLCGPSQPELRAAIVALSAAFVAWQAGVDPTGEEWVTVGGERYLELVADGVLAPL